MSKDFKHNNYQNNWFGKQKEYKRLRKNKRAKKEIEQLLNEEFVDVNRTNNSGQNQI